LEGRGEAARAEAAGQERGAHVGETVVATVGDRKVGWEAGDSLGNVERSRQQRCRIATGRPFCDLCISCVASWIQRGRAGWRWLDGRRRRGRMKRGDCRRCARLSPSQRPPSACGFAPLTSRSTTEKLGSASCQATPSDSLFGPAATPAVMSDRSTRQELRRQNRETRPFPLQCLLLLPPTPPYYLRSRKCIPLHTDAGPREATGWE